VFLYPGGPDPNVSVSVSGARAVLSAADSGTIGSVGGIRLDHSLQPRAKATASGLESDELKSLGYVE
jgi:hypothetical protein